MFIRAFFTAFLLASCSVAQAQGPTAETEQLQQQAQQIVQQFVSRLKPTLQQALSHGGPAQAIQVCSQQAPAIAEQLSRESGWQVKRVSLKPRNYLNAHPDPWEADQLRDFDRRQSAGEPAAKINVAATVDGHFRYLQAQGVEPICLTCHGEQINSEVRDVLRDFYPEDMATGYRLGQVRGAVSVMKELEQVRN